MCCDQLIENITNQGILIWIWESESRFKCKKINKTAKKLLNKNNPFFNKDKLTLEKLPFETKKLENTITNIYHSLKNNEKIDNKTWNFSSTNGLEMKVFCDSDTEEVYMLIQYDENTNVLFKNSPVGMGILQITKNTTIKMTNMKYITTNNSFKKYWGVLINDKKVKSVVKQMMTNDSAQLMVDSKGGKYVINKFVLDSIVDTSRSIEDFKIFNPQAESKKVYLGIIINNLNNKQDLVSTPINNKEIFKAETKKSLINNVELQLTSIYGMIDILSDDNKDNIREACDNIHEILYNYYHIIQIKDGSLELSKSYFDVRKLLTSITEKYSEEKVVRKVHINNNIPPVLYCDTNKVTYAIESLINLLIDYNVKDKIDIFFNPCKLELYNGRNDSYELSRVLSVLSADVLEIPEGIDIPNGLLISWYFLKLMKGKLIYESTDKLKVALEFQVKNKEPDFDIIINQYANYYNSKKILIGNKGDIDVANILYEIEARPIIIEDVANYLKKGSPADVIIIDLDKYRTSKDILGLRGTKIPLIGITSLDDKKLRHKIRMLNADISIINKPVTKINMFNTLIDMPCCEHKIEMDIQPSTDKSKLSMLAIGHMDINQKILIKKIRDLGYNNIDVLSDITNAKVAINKYNVVIINISKLTPTLKQIVIKIKKYVSENKRKIVIIGIHNGILLTNSQRKELYNCGLDLILETTKKIKGVLELIEKKV